MIRQSIFLSLILATSLTQAQEVPKPETPAAGHDAHAPGSAEAAIMSGLKKEMIAGLTEADFLRLGDKPNTVKIVLVAVWNANNYGMNFNGHSKGGALYTIPKGWEVEVTFINPSAIPHSVVVGEKADTKKLQIKDPYFKGAGVPEHLKGIAFEKKVFTFTPDEAGEFAFVCGFPAHAMNGHWVGLDVSEEAKVPTLKVGEAAAKEASPAKAADAKQEEPKKEAPAAVEKK
jgi:plastocyanin